MRRIQLELRACKDKLAEIPLLLFRQPNISNTELLQRANMEPVASRMRRQKWGLVGHTLRKNEKCITRKAMEWNHLISAGRLPGRPRETWRKTVARELKIIGKIWNELKVLAHNAFEDRLY